MMNNELNQTGAEFEEQQNALKADASREKYEATKEDRLEDEGHMYPDDCDQDEYAW